MKKFLLVLVLVFLATTAYATNSPLMVGDTVSALNASSITDALATHARSRAVWVGTTQSLDFSFDGSTWVTFQGATAGTLLPLQVVGARKTAASAAPTAGDVLLLY